ncbi:MAG: SRPBCC family protein [Pseudomonadota bacterium]
MAEASSAKKSEAKVVKKINASADDLWQVLSNFSSIQPGGPIEAVTYEGEGVGMIRNITMGGGTVVERLDIHDSAARTFAYSIINDDSPLPFSDYSATVQISDDGDGTSTVDWTGTFVPRGVPEEQAINTATGIYAGAIKGAKLALEAD